MPPTPPEADFVETLPFRGRVLVRRLESFGDIVFGFSISELALQLGQPKHPADLIANPIRYVLFFGTFAIIAIAWLRFHRMLSLAFAPGRIDLGCAFTYLAFTALLPYALYSFTQAHGNKDLTYVLAAYQICLIGSSTAAFVLSFRGIGRARDYLTTADLARLYQRTYIEGAIALIFLASLAVDVTVGPAESSYVLPLIPIAVRLVRQRYRAPGWAAVHVHGVE